VSACGGGAPSPTPPAGPAAGGTLRVGLITTNLAPEAYGLPPGFDYALDPGVLGPTSWELYRCCLVRTLLASNGRPTAHGGAELRPDLAATMPEVSPDGLTWTFRLKQGIHYAPPLTEVEITARDFVRALERALSPSPQLLQTCCSFSPYLNGDFFYYLGVIEGTEAFARGDADTISGVEAPDEHTLVVHLTQATGDLGYRFSLPMMAPIPPNPSAPGARLGVAEGHETGYGRFLVATGPYMVEGAEELDFSLPPSDQRPASGYVPGTSITLVRNPSWDRETDELRPAYPDRLVLENQPSSDEAAARIDAATLDLFLDANAPIDQVRRYDRTPELRSRIHHTFNDFTGAVTMNLAVPPFDDVHVRRAMNLIVDKEGIRQLFGVKPLVAFGYAYGEIATHVAPDSVEGSLLSAYDPYVTPGHRGDLTKAKAEMAQSKYDHDGDGVCDDPVCASILFGVWKDCAHEEMADIVRDSAARIGIDLDIELYPDAATTYVTVLDPRNKIPVTFGLGWGKDFANGSSFFFSPFYGPGLSGVRVAVNASLVGATSDQLQEWGYSVPSVPSIDEKLEQCVTLTGRDQLACWAQTDELLMETVVPWVPFISGTAVVTVSDRVAHYDYDQSFASPALDRIALRE
jgi:peptide/nickel transport system substrate-binding protein